jgi:type I restriction enzyme, S subunit
MTQRKSRSREGWTRVRFGDVVRLATERCTDPLGAGIERYVGLEHLEPGDLRIRSWGNVADGVTFTNRFRPGQVLFGKRRAYQRKVAVADFDGICSSDIYVFEPSDDRLLPDLLPFICQTDGFFEHALKTSAGSLSPRTNWTSLSDYEFDLPPAEEQRRRLQVLKALKVIREAYEDTLASATEVNRAAPEQLFAEAARSCECLTLGGICDITSGCKNSEEADADGTYPFFTCGPEPLRSKTFSFDCEAILLPGNNACGVYKPHHYVGKFEARQRVYVIRLKPSVEITYGFLFLALERSLRFLRNRSVGTQSKHITIADLRSVPVPRIPLPQQRTIVETSSDLSATCRAFHGRGETLSRLAMSILADL